MASSSKRSCWDEASVASQASFLSILTEMSVVKRQHDHEQRLEKRRERRRKEKKERARRGPVDHPARFDVSTTTLFDRTGSRARSAWLQVTPQRHSEPPRPPRRARERRARTPAPWKPVGGLSTYFGDPPLHELTPKLRKKSLRDITRQIEELERDAREDAYHDRPNDVVIALRDLAHQRDDELQWARDHNPLHVAADSSVAAVRFRSSLKK